MKEVQSQAPSTPCGMHAQTYIKIFLCLVQQMLSFTCNLGGLSKAEKTHNLTIRKGCNVGLIYKHSQG